MKAQVKAGQLTELTELTENSCDPREMCEPRVILLQSVPLLRLHYIIVVYIYTYFCIFRDCT